MNRDTTLRSVVQAALVGILFGACADSPTPPNLESLRSPYVQAVAPTSHLVIPRDGDVALTASGSFKPGEVVMVETEITGRRFAKAEFEIVSLDEAGESSERVRAIRSGTEQLSKGSVAKRAAEITFDKPGYYRLAARLSSQPDNGAGRVTTSLAVLWVLIDTNGGFSAEQYDTGALEGRVLTKGAYGAFKPKHVKGTDSAALLDRGLPHTVSGRVTYYDGNAGQRVALASATLNAMCLDDNDFTLASPVTSTGTDGSFSFSCPAATTYSNGVVTLVDDYVRVRGEGGGAVDYAFYEPVENYVDHYIGNDAAADAFTILHYVAPQAVSYFSQSIGRIDVNVSPDDPTYGAYYQQRLDEVWLNYSFVFAGDTWGYFVVGHEYGHAFHDKALAGTADGITGEYWCSSSGHTIEGEYTLSCGIVEGFADYFIAQVGGATVQSFANAFSSNPYRSYGDGSIIEGAVAGLFWDLASSFGGFYTSQALRTCSAYSSPSWIAPVSGVDEYVYCLENSLAMQGTGFFQTRSRTYSTYTESAIEPQGWSTSAVRTLWKYNLYNL